MQANTLNHSHNFNCLGKPKEGTCLLFNIFLCCLSPHWLSMINEASLARSLSGYLILRVCVCVCQKVEYVHLIKGQSIFTSFFIQKNNSKWLLQQLWWYKTHRNTDLSLRSPKHVLYICKYTAVNQLHAITILHSHLFHMKPSNFQMDCHFQQHLEIICKLKPASVSLTFHVWLKSQQLCQCKRMIV